MGILKKITNAAGNNSTYRVGLLQTKAYRVLKQHTGKALASSSISSVEWAFLGILFDNKKGIRGSDAAEMLGVEAPFITSMAAKLMDMSFLDQKKDESDGRAKMLVLTDKGLEFVETTEKQLRKEMKQLVEGVSIAELFGYLTTLQRIVDNGKALGDDARKTADGDY